MGNQQKYLLSTVPSRISARTRRKTLDVALILRMHFQMRQTRHKKTNKDGTVRFCAYFFISPAYQACEYLSPHFQIMSNLFRDFHRSHFSRQIENRTDRNEFTPVFACGRGKAKCINTKTGFAQLTHAKKPPQITMH